MLNQQLFMDTYSQGPDLENRLPESVDPGGAKLLNNK